MSSPHPTRHTDENPQLRLFLDRASAVVAQCGGLNARSRILLGRLADELGLSRDEAEPAIHTLLLENEDFGPKQSNGNGSRRTAPPKPPPLPRRDADEGGPAPANAPPVVIDDDAVLQNFTDKASYILAQHGGWNAKSRVILEQLARSMGVTPREMEAALASLHDAERGVEVVAAPPTPPPPPPGAPAETPHHPAPSGSAPPPVSGPGDSTPPPPSAPSPLAKPKPQEVYRTYLHKAMDELKRPRINPRRERRLIEQATHKLGLSPVLARQLLLEVARERNVTLESLKAEATTGPAEDPRIAEFLRRARAIIAEQRGITVAGQVKISAAAHELGLSDEERQRAMALLQEGAAPASAGDRLRGERLSAFREHMRPALGALPRKIITPDVVATFVQQGVELHGVEPEDAEKAVRDVAASLGIRYVSQQRAVEHVSRLVAEKMGGSAVLHEADRKRIFAEGKQWGLSTPDIQALVVEQVEINRQLQSARRRRTGVLLALVGAAAVTALCVGGAWVVLRGVSPKQTTVSDAAEGAGLGADADAGAAPPPVDHWWDVELSVAMSRAEIELHYLSSALRQVRAYSPVVRGDGYEKLVRGLSRAGNSHTATKVLKDILAGCYALDPSDEAADRLRERLVAVIPAPSDPLPESVQPFRDAYLAAQIATAAIAREGVPETRIEAMERSLSRVLGLTIDPAWDNVTLHRRTMAALSQMLYGAVASAAAERPHNVEEHYAFVIGEARNYLEPPEVERLDAQFLDALLSASEEPWRQYQDAILRVVNSSEPGVVLQAVELMENASDRDLRDYLGAGLLRRIGVRPDGQSLEDVAALVREEFGASITPAERDDDRRRRFGRAAEDLLSRLDARPGQSLELLEETANLARVSAMGCVLSQGELQHGAFEELAEMEEVSLERTPVVNEEPTRDPVASARAKLVTRYIDSLSRATHSVQRVGYLRGVVENASEVREISPEEGEMLAEYFLSPMTDEERDAILDFIPQVGHWKAVRLALADQVLQTRIRREVVEDVVGRALRVKPTVSGDEDWRKQLRAALMRSVLERGPAVSRAAPHDAAQETMLELYQIQAQALGVPASAYSGAASPSLVLAAMIEQLASRLSGAAASDDDRRFLARVPHELVVAEYLGDNDLRRLVLLERIWLRLLAIDAATKRPERASEAKSIVDNLHESDRRAPDILVQARNGQAALVHLWAINVGHSLRE